MEFVSSVQDKADQLVVDCVALTIDDMLTVIGIDSAAAVESLLKLNKITTDSAIALIGKQQDRIYKGDNWLMVQDGHGGNACIHFLDTLDYNAIMQLENPAEEIHRRVEEKSSRYDESGSTLCFARVLEERGCIEIVNVGDSQAEVYIDGNLVFRSIPHTRADADLEELERAKLYEHPHVPCRPGQTLKVLTPSHITYSSNPICVFRNGKQLVPTMALGHENMTGFKPTKTYIPFLPGQKVRVCVYSDGVADMKIDGCAEDQHDMQMLSAQQLLDKFVGRWKQNWLYVADESKLEEGQETNMGGGYDDVCIGVLEIN
uniref:PPM-type phosphatase domain-containing protein n=1 Tax=viral metagenome TaxID=1070528 RepID=A0A6C0F5Y2_9ZZZZ